MFVDLMIRFAPLIAEASGEGGSDAPPSFPMLPMFLIMTFLFYFMAIRPQQKRQQEQQALIEALKEKDKVVTAGGIYGQIVSIKGEEVTIRIDDRKDIQMRVQRSMIAGIKGADSEQQTDPDALNQAS